MKAKRLLKSFFHAPLKVKSTKCNDAVSFRAIKKALSLKEEPFIIVVKLQLIAPRDQTGIIVCYAIGSGLFYKTP